ncbi:MAG: AraC family transcriptional regulator [Acidobacteria bacterium]|nr:AraC family transcriptional regulator [Acidobacteriota bacterium]
MAILPTLIFTLTDSIWFSTMQIKSLNEQIQVWRPDGFPGIELRKGFCVSQPYPKHWHEEFHFCLILSGGGELNYRRERYYTPVGSLSIVHPGEVHSNHTEEQQGCSYLNLYLEPEMVQQIAVEITRQEKTLPFFSPQPIDDPDTVRLFQKLHKSLEGRSARLEQDELLIGFVSELITNRSESKLELAEVSREQKAVNRVRDYLAQNFAENVSLDSLAGLADLSPFHLNRVFRKELGLPPHAFQTQMRIARAKSLLRQGSPISQTASEVGFVDQSHFTRHFRRLVGVTPGYYLQGSKNVQD